MAGLRDFLGGFAGSLPKSFEIEDQRKGREQYQQQLDLTKSAQESRVKQEFIKGKQFKATLASLGLKPQQVMSLSEDVDDEEDIPFNQAQVVFSLLNKQQLASSMPSLAQTPYVNEQRVPLAFDKRSNRMIPVQGSPINGQEQSFLPRPRVLPAEQAGQLGDFETLDKQIQTVIGSAKPDFVGPASFNIKRAQAYTPMANEDFENFRANVNSIQNQIIYLRSGKQINETEFVRLMQELPDPNLNYNAFITRLDNFQRVFNQIMMNRRQALGGAGYVLPGQPPEASPALPQAVSPLEELRRRRNSGQAR